MEEKLGTIPGVNIHSFEIVYDLIFTSNRIIAANIKHPGDLPPDVSLRTVIIGDGWNRHERMMKRIKLMEARREVIQNAAPEELLKNNPRNFAIPYERVVSIEVKRRFLRWQIICRFLDDKKTARKISFNIRKSQVPEARRLAAAVKI
ncbi:MAG: hypothetical protein JW967_04480 [Dehalococcoidales bacterium]|nr:hypothetical protein [Dehalococcoidales bacterium]